MPPATGLGRAALIALNEDLDAGLIRLVECLELELRLLVSAVGKHHSDAVGIEDLRTGSAAPS